jgi:hypothetical protein
MISKGFLHSFICVLCVAVCVVTVPSCNKTDTLDVNYHREYYPLAVGHYVTYQVDSIQYSFSENPDTYVRDTIRYQLKEILTDTFYDNENELNYRLELHRRFDTLSSFSIWKIWNVKADVYNIQKNEDDIRFIKLIFPPLESGEWNGNLYVPQTDIYRIFRNWNYTYSNVHEPYSAGGLNFDSTLTVLQVDDEDLIEKTLRREVYAKNIGMVYQEWEHMTKQKVQLNWQNGPENGFRIRMKAVDWN